MNRNHFENKALAEELAKKLDDEENIGFYYALAKEHDHQFLRGIMYWASDYPDARNKGSLFTWKLKVELAKKESQQEEENRPENFPQINKTQEIRRVAYSAIGTGQKTPTATNRRLEELRTFVNERVRNHGDE